MTRPSQCISFACANWGTCGGKTKHEFELGRVQRNIDIVIPGMRRWVASYFGPGAVGARVGL